MLKFSSALIALALAVPAFAEVASITPANPDSSAQISPAVSHSFHTVSKVNGFTIVEDPTSCGGVPSPRMLPQDGYRTQCVNGVLRFIEEKSTHKFQVTLWRTEDGKKKLLQHTTLTTQINKPVFFSSGQTVSYVQSAVTDGATDKTSLQIGEVFSGVQFTLDPTERESDGSLNLSVLLNAAELQSLDDFTTADGLKIQKPRMKSTNEQSKLHVVPGKPSTFVSDDLTFEVTATPFN